MTGGPSFLIYLKADISQGSYFTERYSWNGEWFT